MARWGNQQICSGKAFGKQVSPVYVIFKRSVCTIDAMAFLHKIKVEKKTFGYLTKNISASALKDGTGSDWIAIIFDV